MPRIRLSEEERELIINYDGTPSAIQGYLNPRYLVLTASMNVDRRFFAGVFGMELAC